MRKEKIKKYFLIFLTAFLFSNIFFVVSALADNSTWQVPTLEINFPQQVFKDAVTCLPNGDGTQACSVPWIADYISAVYNYAVGIVGIVAVVVMMLGGVIWMTAGGSAPRISEAKAWITAALTGLVLVLSSYTILYLVNPELTQFQPLQISTVHLDKSEGDSGAAATAPTSKEVLDAIAKAECNGEASPSNDIQALEAYMTKCGKKYPPNNCTNYIRDVCTESGSTSGLPASNLAKDWYAQGSDWSTNNLQAGTIMAYEYQNSDGSACASPTGHVFICYNAGCTLSYNNGSIISTPSFRLQGGGKYNGCISTKPKILTCGK